MRIAWCGLLLAFGVPAIHAQGPVNVIVTVRDPTGAVIPKAEVSVSEMVKVEAPYVQVMRPGTERQVASDHTGPTGDTQFALPAGTYEISVASPGFRRLRIQAEVVGSSEQRVDVVLEIGFYSGPVVVVPDELPLVSVPVNELIPKVDLPELMLRARVWKRFRGHR